MLFGWFTPSNLQFFPRTLFPTITIGSKFSFDFSTSKLLLLFVLDYDFPRADPSELHLLQTVHNSEHIPVVHPRGVLFRLRNDNDVRAALDSVNLHLHLHPHGDLQKDQENDRRWVPPKPAAILNLAGEIKQPWRFYWAD